MKRDKVEYNEEEAHPMLSPGNSSVEETIHVSRSVIHIRTKIAMSSIVVSGIILIVYLSGVENSPLPNMRDQFRSTLRKSTHLASSIEQDDTLITKNSNKKSGSSKLNEKQKKDTRIADRISRPFLPFRGQPDEWCINESDYDPEKPAGLFYVKVPKAASTTSASVTLQISNRHGKRHIKKLDEPVCHHFFHHVQAKERGFQKRDMNKSILWTTIREPTKRAMSFVFFKKISRMKKEPTDEIVINFLRTFEDNFQMNYISTLPLEWEPGARNIGNRDTDAVEKVIQDYDFIAITERMEESFVTMKLLFGLDFADIVFFSSKVSGGWDGGRKEIGCLKIEPTFISDNVGSYLASDEWQSKNSADFLMFEAANRSLDKTIAQFDAKQFQAELQQYHTLMQEVQEVCADKIIFRCTEDGVFQEMEAKRNCYYRDQGCGYQCIDEFIRLRVDEDQPFNIVKKKMSNWRLPDLVDVDE